MTISAIAQFSQLFEPISAGKTRVSRYQLLEFAGILANFKRVLIIDPSADRPK